MRSSLGLMLSRVSKVLVIFCVCSSFLLISVSYEAASGQRKPSKRVPLPKKRSEIVRQMFDMGKSVLERDAGRDDLQDYMPSLREFMGIVAGVGGGLGYLAPELRLAQCLNVAIIDDERNKHVFRWIDDDEETIHPVRVWCSRLFGLLIETVEANMEGRFFDLSQAREIVGFGESVPLLDKGSIGDALDLVPIRWDL